MESRASKLSLLVITLLLIIVTGCSNPLLTTGSSTTPKPGNTTTQKSQPNVITFSVTVPPNTPPEDDIYIRLESGKDIKMEKTGDFTWQVDYQASPGVKVSYGYNRNGVGYEASEEIATNDTESDWNRKRSTSVKLAEHKVQQDTITKWRWLLDAPLQAAISNDTVEFLPRVNGLPFYRGIYVIDYWWNIFFTNGETEDTVARIKSDHADLVQYAPTWAVKLTDDSISLDPSVSYTYSKEAMRYETRAARAAGLKVVYRNQVWIDLSVEEVTRPRPPEFWAQYYQVRNQYLTEMAALAEEEGAEAFCIGGDSDSLGSFTAWGSAPPESVAHLVDDIRQVRQIYKGKLYYDFVLLGDMASTWEMDWAKWQPVIDELDFIGISWWKGFTDKDDVTLAELKQNVAGLFDLYLKPLYEKTGLPIVITGLYFPSADGGATGKYAWNAREIAVWQPDDGVTVNDFQEQADVYEAVMLAVAARPWIVGAYPAGFWRHDQQDKAHTIRAKPAEDVIKKWYGFLSGGD